MAATLRAGPDSMTFCTNLAMGRGSVPQRGDALILYIHDVDLHYHGYCGEALKERECYSLLVTTVTTAQYFSHEGKQRPPSPAGRNLWMFDAMNGEGSQSELVESTPVRWQLSWAPEKKAVGNNNNNKKGVGTPIMPLASQQRVLWLPALPFDVALRGALPDQSHARHSINGDEYVRVCDQDTGDIVLSYCPPTRTRIPEEVLAAAKEGLTANMAKSQESTQRGDAAPDVIIDEMWKRNTECNYIRFDKKSGYYLQTKPLSDTTQKKRVWKRNMAVRTYSAGFVPGRRQGGRQSLTSVVQGRYSKRHPSTFAKASPFFKALWKCSQEELGIEGVTSISDMCPKWLWLGGEVPWPSVQLNLDTSLCYHLDTHDVEGQWSLLTVLYPGSVPGGAYILPEYSLSVTLAEGGLLLSRPNRHWHGVSGLPHGVKRLSVVLYMSKKLLRACQEEERACSHQKRQRAAEDDQGELRWKTTLKRLKQEMQQLRKASGHQLN